MGYKTTADGSRISANPDWRLGQSKFLRTDNGTAGMNVDGRAEGTPDVVWNGDETAWTLEAQGAAETYAAHDGTYGLDSGLRTVGQDTRFDSGVNQDIAGTYGVLQFWMQPKAYPTGADFRVRFKTEGGNNPGNTLSIEDYVTDMDLDVWQHVQIPIADFALSADVAQVEFEYGVKGQQQFWLDEFELIPGGGQGGPFLFRVAAPDAVSIYHVSRLAITLAEENSDWTSGNFTNLDELASGLLLRHVDLAAEGEVLWSINFKTNMDLMGRLTIENDVLFANGEHLFTMTLDPLSSSIIVTDTKVLEWVVRDNLSTINNLRAFVQYGVEVIA